MYTAISRLSGPVISTLYHARQTSIAEIGGTGATVECMDYTETKTDWAVSVTCPVSDCHCVTCQVTSHVEKTSTLSVFLSGVEANALCVIGSMSAVQTSWSQHYTECNKSILSLSSAADAGPADRQAT